MQNLISRRVFVKASAASVATLASMGFLSACAPEAKQSAPAAGDAEVEEFDVVVVGGGLAGLISAISAKREGSRSVVVLEKLNMLGGCAVGSSVGIVADSQYTPENVDDSLERIVALHRDLQSYSIRDSEYPDYKKVEYYFSETGKTYDMLRDMGAEVTDVLEGGTRAWYKYPNGAQGYIDSLVALAEKEGVTIEKECPVEQLVIDGEEIIGVIANRKGASTRFNAKSIILCTGGFGSNNDMLAHFVPEAVAAGLINRGTSGATGECIQMALDAGAAGFSDSWITISGGSVVLADDIVEACDGIEELKLTSNTADNVIVNSAGNRFVREAVPDQSVIGNYMVCDGNGPFYLLYGNPAADQQALFDQGVSAGCIFKADTVGELEEAIGIPSGNLVATLDAYDEFCSSGRDEYFGKAAEHLVPLKAPFYALEFYTKMIGTMGGIQTNTDMEVLSENGQPIEGLFAAGEITNRDLYNQIYLGGACIGIYSTMGRLAGATAAARVLSA